MKLPGAPDDPIILKVNRERSSGPRKVVDIVRQEIRLEELLDGATFGAIK
jgi:hypothetical protein